ncbi:gp33 family protein [Sporanaerobium hydrogeniformans]|uniref:gp33 family protein n=1 Tax=Sporanaerobium hydrogeniformans TaxID=3072179 RepID=UPI00267FB76E|nr:hypothetical protein [Sporanaerobium hydrogeniformans]
MSRVLEAATKLKNLKDRKAELEEITKEVSAEIESAEQELLSIMTEDEIPKFVHAGTSFSMTNKVFASARADKKDELFEALRENGLGDLIKEQVNAQSLRSAVIEQMEDNDDELPKWLDGLVNVFEKPVINLRKAGK